MSEIPTINIPDSAVELASEVYENGLQSTVRETSKVVSRIPKLINAALAPLDIWILQREYNVEHTKQLLHDKLKDADPDKITAPEAYVAIPAFQAISYSMDSTELRNLYANLLAKSMYEDTKEMVHPSFIDAIKQMSPNDAKILSQLSGSDDRALVDLITQDSFHVELEMCTEYCVLEINISGYDISNHQLQSASFTLLEKLGLICINTAALVNSRLYEEIFSSSEYRLLTELHSGKKDLVEKRKSFSITDLGKLFIDICINDLIPV